MADGPAPPGDDVALVLEGPLDLAALQARAAGPRWGALASFVGSVRSPNRGRRVERIDYEGYEAMMRAQMLEVAAVLRAARPLGRVVIAHRLGRLGPGEASIAVVVSAEHRREALAACAEGIDLLKERLPVWKYEVDERGEGWVEGSSAAAEPL